MRSRSGSPRARRAHAGVAHGAGRVRVRRSSGGAGAGRGVQPVGGRGARRGHVLRRLPLDPAQGARSCRSATPRRARAAVPRCVAHAEPWSPPVPPWNWRRSSASATARSARRRHAGPGAWPTRRRRRGGLDQRACGDSVTRAHSRSPTQRHHPRSPHRPSHGVRAARCRRTIRGSRPHRCRVTQHPEVHVVRTGSRGMLWLEPMIEVATAAGTRRLRAGHRRRRPCRCGGRRAARRRAPVAARARRRPPVAPASEPRPSAASA